MLKQKFSEHFIRYLQEFRIEQHRLKPFNVFQTLPHEIRSKLINKLLKEIEIFDKES